MDIAKLLKEQSEYIAALYSIVYLLQMKEFGRNDDPLGTAIAAARGMRLKLLNAEPEEEPISRLVVKFFDEIVADLQFTDSGTYQ